MWGKNGLCTHIQYRGASGLLRDVLSPLRVTVSIPTAYICWVSVEEALIIHLGTVLTSRGTPTMPVCLALTIVAHACP